MTVVQKVYRFAVVMATRGKPRDQRDLYETYTQAVQAARHGEYFGGKYENWVLDLETEQWVAKFSKPYEGKVLDLMAPDLEAVRQDYDIDEQTFEAACYEWLAQHELEDE